MLRRIYGRLFVSSLCVNGRRLLHGAGKSRTEREDLSTEGLSTTALDAFIRAKALTTHHPLGTCKAGVASDPMAVVDADLRVFGTRNLRVVDASVMPDMVGGNINGPVMMIAEKAADLIRGRHGLAMGAARNDLANA